MLISGTTCNIKQSFTVTTGTDTKLTNTTAGESAYLYKICGDDGQLGLGAGQPDGLDDEVAGSQLGVQDQVIRH